MTCGRRGSGLVLASQRGPATGRARHPRRRPAAPRRARGAPRAAAVPCRGPAAGTARRAEPRDHDGPVVGRGPPSPPSMSCPTACTPHGSPSTGSPRRSSRRPAAARCAVTVRGRNLPRVDPDVEAAVYFCCLEAMQNAVKHARASRVDVRLAVRDGCADVHGHGRRRRVRRPAAAAGSGTGMQNMRDRLEAARWRPRRGLRPRRRHDRVRRRPVLRPPSRAPASGTSIRATVGCGGLTCAPPGTPGPSSWSPRPSPWPRRSCSRRPGSRSGRPRP